MEAELQFNGRTLRAGQPSQLWEMSEILWETFAPCTMQSENFCTRLFFNFFLQWLNRRHLAKPQLERTVFAPDQPLSWINTFCTHCMAITQVAAGLGSRTSCAAAELFDVLTCTQTDVLFVLFNVITQIKIPLHLENRSISDTKVMHRKWRELVATAACLWVMKRAAIMSLDDVKRPKRSDVFALGFSLSWCGRCFCYICSLALTPVLPAAAQTFHDSYLPLCKAG